MARRTKKDKAKAKESAKKQIPEGFGRQAVAFLMGAVLAPLLLLAIFGFGGSLPVALFEGAQWLLGSVAYLAPVFLIFLSISIFRAEDHKLPRIKLWGMLLLLMSLTGLFHLGVDQNRALEAADAGDNGGMLGYLTTALLLPILDTVGTMIVLIGFGLVSLLLVMGISIKDFLMMLLSPFRNEELMDGEGKPVKSNFKLNEGVPIEKAGALNNFRDTADKLTKTESHDPLTAASDPNWELPGLELLIDKQDQANPGNIEGNADVIKATLADFNIEVEMEGANVGPRVTQYTLKPPPGVRLSKIVSLDKDLSLNLAAESIRIEAPIPGKSAVGVEVPNQKAASVRVHGVLSSKEWGEVSSPLSFVIGRDIAGVPIIGELDKMPHLLIAGQTGSGKSVMINTILTSLLYRNSPSDLKMILVDPKHVELKPFDEIPHLLTPVITEPEKTISALKWAVAEMERRYRHLADAKKRSIIEYNQLKDAEKMPYIIVVIDELAELMMMAARDVEALIVRLAQKSRAVGLHLVLATQRPSVNVITGLIKANVPARIAFTVAQQVDSRTILDQSGAEKLLGTGDMLYTTAQMPKPKRIQGALIETTEINKVTDFVRAQRAPEYDDEVVSQPVQIGGSGGAKLDTGEVDDSLYQDAVHLVVETGKASTSFLQRRFSIGYTRAARLIDMMEDQGIVAPAHGNKPRDVLVRPDQQSEVFGSGADDEQVE